MTGEHNMQQPKLSTPLALLSILPTLVPRGPKFGAGDLATLWAILFAYSFLSKSSPGVRPKTTAWSIQEPACLRQMGSTFANVSTPGGGIATGHTPTPSHFKATFRGGGGLGGWGASRRGGGGLPDPNIYGLK